jgi:hypothetical protein
MNHIIETKRGDIPDLANQLLTRLRAHGEKCYRLHWTGSKIPRGATVDGKPRTQHGIVYVDGPFDGRQAGYYVRTQEWTGQNNDEHEMLISTNGTVEPGPEQTCELVRDFSLEVPEA